MIDFATIRQEFEKWLRALAPLPISAACVALVWIIWRGGWPDSAAELQLQILGTALYILLAILGLWQTFKEIKSITANTAAGGISINSDDNQEVEKTNG